MSEGLNALRRSLTWGVVAFGVALAVVIGVRMEPAALTLAVGVGCGVGASIPTSVLIFILLQRKNDNRAMGRAQARTHPQSLLVVSPQGAVQERHATLWPQEYSAPAPLQRQFAVIGEEETIDL